MFTGIVEELGTIAAIEGGGEGLQLQIEAPGLAPLAGIGDSINVSGCCLTVVAVRGSVLAFEAVPETLRRTALGGLAAGARVNLEDALRAGEPYGGHIVQGHVDGVGELVERREEGIGLWLRFSAPENVQRYLIEKGSVTVAGREPHGRSAARGRIRGRNRPAHPPGDDVRRPCGGRSRQSRGRHDRALRRASAGGFAGTPLIP